MAAAMNRAEASIELDPRASSCLYKLTQGSLHLGVGEARRAHLQGSEDRSSGAVAPGENGKVNVIGRIGMTDTPFGCRLVKYEPFPEIAALRQKRRQLLGKPE